MYILCFQLPPDILLRQTNPASCSPPVIPNGVHLAAAGDVDFRLFVPRSRGSHFDEVVMADLRGTVQLCM